MPDETTRILFGLNIGYPHPPNFMRSFNIGTLRTLIVAEELSKSIGVPLDIRLWHEPGGDVWANSMSARVTDAMACLLWMKIDVRNVYELNEGQPNEKMIRERVSPELVDGAIETLTRHPSTMCRNPRLDVLWDDVFGQDGTVLVTGDERVNFDSYCETWYGPIGQHEVSMSETRWGFGQSVTVMKRFFDSIGIPNRRLEIPVIKTENGHRMGPLNEDVVWWNVLRPIDGTIVRKFLLSTAMNPSDPVSAPPFSIDGISLNPYIWSWDMWYAFLEENR